jgi:hypothetical protein
MEGNYVDLSDRRYGLDTKNRNGTVTFGVDRKLNADVVAGFSFGLQKAQGSGFSDFMHSDSEGFTAGPYAAARLSPQWAIDAAFTYTQNRSNLQIVMLNGAATLRTYSGSFNLHGQYTFGEWYMRPRFGVTYAHNVGDARDMQGVLLGVPLTLRLSDSKTDYGVAEAYGEISRLFALPGAIYMIPYMEFGLHYEFERPNGGQILTGDLSTATPSPWAGSVRSGARIQLPNAALVEASVGYLSFAQSGLDVWEGKVRFSLGF